MSYAVIRNLRRTGMLFQQNRLETTMTNLTQEDFVFRPPIAQWGKVIREAEKIVGYPTSFMNLRWLLSDEFANMAMHLRKVVGSNHPIVQTAKTVLYNEHNNLQPWGLVILLLSKAVHPTINMLQSNSVTQKQRVLAELTEMIRTGHYVHRGLLNIPVEKQRTADTEMFANKIAVLIGDYLLVTANGMLARIKNQDLSYLISTALRDISEGEFYGDRDSQNMPIPAKPRPVTVDEFDINSDTLPLDTREAAGSPVREWTLRTMYNGGSLFGRGCQGAVLLAGLSIEEQETAYLLGAHLCLAWQASSELQKITSENKETFSLVSAPVLFALNENPKIYESIERCKTNVTQINYDDLRDDILKTEAIERTRILFEENAHKARNYVNLFGDSESIQTINRLIKTL